MKSITAATTPILILQFLGALRLTQAFTTPFLSHRYPLLPVANNDISFSRLYLAPPPTDFLDQIQNIHHASQVITESSNDITQLLSETFLGLGGKQEVLSQSAQLDSLSTLKSVSSATIASPISTPTAAATLSTSSAVGPPFVIQNTDPSEFQPMKLDAEQMEFYAQEVDMFAKLPLAALVYVVFDFFFLQC